MEELTYLGHRVSAKGIEVDAQKVAAVYRMKAPENAKQVKSFLGMAGFYRQFIDKFAQRAGPLTELLQKDVAFQWGEAQQKSFEDLKKAMTSTPVLVFPDFSKQFEVHTDAKWVWYCSHIDPKRS